MKLKNPFRKTIPSGCEWEDFCTNCHHPTPRGDHCSLCKQYRSIDSGYGWCNLLPKPIIVGWCRDPCSYYHKVREEG